MTDVVELRTELEEATARALKIADELAVLVAAGVREPKVAKLAADYQATRGEIRFLRRALVAEVAG